MTDEQITILKGYLDASIVRSIEYPCDTAGAFKIVSEAGGYRYVDIITTDGRTQTDSMREVG